MKLKRLQALFLVVVMIFSMTANTIPAFAVSSEEDSGLCPHHTSHVDCSYREGSAGSPCTHEHDANCGYREAKDEVLCDQNCTDMDNDGIINHVDGCAYEPAVEAQPCTHKHDDQCGYEAPVEPVPCDFVCPICDCTCTSRCEDGSGNETCPVCSENPEDCTFTTIEVSLTFDAEYAEYGQNAGANLQVVGKIDGKKVTQAQVRVSLTAEEAAMLDVSGSSISLDDNVLTFTLTNDEETGEVSLSESIPVKASTLSSLNISKEDIAVSISPEEYQTSSLVGVTLAGDELKFVKMLPADGASYGSGTSYASQVSDVTVHFVDSDGKSAPRQEIAPTFTLYYQIEGQTPVAVQEGNLPFGMEEIPDISTQAEEDTWTGRVTDASSLPSTVLGLQDGAYVEKSVTWFLQPSYPDDYYENAGELVEITDANASEYPTGLGRGWYFIGGVEPFPDDVVSVKEYLASLTHDVYWADNGNAEGMRPSDLDGLFELQYALDGSSNYQTLTEENMEELGLETIPEPTTSLQGGVWQVDWQNSLPSKVSYSDSAGNGTSLTRDVSWRVVFHSAPDSYAMVEITAENAHDYSSVDNQYGTYYVLETSLTFTARIYQGNSEYKIEDIREAFLDQFYLDASYTGDQHQYFQLASVRDDGHYKPEDNPNDPNIITVTVTNLWRYNLDNTRINYSIREGKSADDVDHKLNGVSGLDEGDYFAVSFDNSAVPSFSNEVTAVYSGGILKLTLTGTVEYHATKVWLDDGATDRPTVTMELWRYRSGQSYTTASLVRNANGDPYVLDLSNVSPNPDGSYSVDFVDNLPKYDPEGYRYRYVVREYMSGTNAARYEQVFGVVAQDGTVTDTLPENSSRDSNDTFLYNGGTLSNRLKDTVSVTVTKDWKAASFQSEFDDVMVELRLQSRMKGQDAEWEDTEYTYQMYGFLAENLTVTHVGSYPQYDEWGRELEYRWVEEAVWQGGTIENGAYVGGQKVPSTVNEDGSRSFILQQNGRKITYNSSCGATGDDARENCTVITNSIANVIEYDVTKEFTTPWNEQEYKESYRFTLFRATSGSELERYATFTIDKDTDNEPPEITKHIADGANLSIEQLAEWHVLIHGLPEFDADGQQYEYLLLEGDGSPTTITTERDKDGNYTSTVFNGPGSGNVILIRKEWIDESDTQHRLPVEITIYDRATNKPIGTPVTLGTDTWYQIVGIGEYEPDQVYILETKVGQTEVNHVLDGNGKPTLPTYTGTKTAVRFSTQYHEYEATYSYEADFGASTDGAYEGLHCYTVTNRRLGNINLTVTKNWIDGDGEMRVKLQEALDAANLQLAVKLEFVSEPSLGLEQVYAISCTGFGNDEAGDTVTISQGTSTPIKDKEGNPVDSVQLLDLTQSEQSLYFWNLPKYDSNGASVRYTVREIFVDQYGTEVTDLTKYPDLAEIWEEYTQTTQEGPYIVGENHALDTQDFTLTNKLDDTTNASWYTLWLDEFSYTEGSRPDIYLNIYARTHNADGSTQTQLVIRNYRWEFEEYQDNPEISQQNFWKCTIENLPEYDSFGYEIDYFAVMQSVVSASDFDYLPTSYAPDAATNNSNVFATSGLIWDNTYEDLIVNVGEASGEANYALLSGNTFVNTIYDTITVSGEKLWTNLPDMYPLVDLPSVTFTLSRSTAGGTEENNIATMTISGSDWQDLNVNGHYVFSFGHTGKNEPTSSFDEEGLPSGEFLLPRFDAKGRLYTYTLTETVNWEGTDAENASENIFEISGSGQTFTNSYNDGTAQIAFKKILTVPAGQEVYSAVKFKLTRTYTTNSGETSEPELVTSSTWSASDVKAAVEAKGASAGDLVTVEYTFTFDDLPVYAPNGSKYNYTITEDTSQMGGFTTWAAKGDLTVEQVETTGQETTAVSGVEAGTQDDIKATFLNVPEETPDPIQLTGGKQWKDLDPSFRPEDPTKGLTVTLERSANSQTGQDNAIAWEKVDITGKITWMQDPQNENRWIYTIVGLERYAPNGMPWIYRVTEEPVPYYTASSGGIATQKSQDSVAGNITMNDLTNSMLTSTSFKKTWVDSEGKTITENLLGDGIELEVAYELQVRAKAETGNEWTLWQSADTYFAAFSALADREYHGTIQAALGDSAWNTSYRGTDNSFNNLPRYIKDATGAVYALEYRVAETAVNVYREGQSEPLLTQVYKAPNDNGENAYAYEVEGNNDLFAPYYGAGTTQANNTTTHRNQLKTTEITVSKIWAGDQNQVYVARPTSTITRYDWEVTLLVQRSLDGGKTWEQEPVETVTLYGTNGEDQKSATVKGLPQFLFDADGKLQICTYRVQELQSAEATAVGTDREPLEAGECFHGSYTVSYSDDGLTVTNTLNTTEFRGVKEWNDEEETHSNITLELKYLTEGGDPEDPDAYESFAPAAEVELGEGKALTSPGNLSYYAESDWTAVWKNVPLRLLGSERDEDTGNTIYKIFETVSDEYIVESETDANTTTITNTPSISLSVTKHWLGVPAEQDVTIVLYRNTAENTTQEQVDSVVLTAAKSWNHTFDPQPVYDSNGNTYTYWVEETLIGTEDANEAAENGGYGISYGGDAEQGFHVYNHKLDTVYVIKDWVDVSDSENRPTDLELTLQRTTETDPDEDDWQTVTDATYTWVKEGSQWQTSFANLPQYDITSGQAYTYRVTETVPAGYEQEVLSSDSNTFHFKNTRSELIDIPVQKVWVDNDNNLKHRSDTITVELYANGQPTGQTLELKPGILQLFWNFLTDSDTGWSGVFEDQPKYDETGTLIEYSVVETTVPEYYQVSYGKNQDGTLVVTNTANGNLTVTKNVTGSGDPAEEFHFTVQLSDETISGAYGEMTFQNGVAEVVLRHGESVTATDLPVGVAYTVTETEANQGAYTTQSSGETGSIPCGDTAEAVFTNDLHRISVAVTKVWQDNDDQDGVRPDEITVTLLANGVETGKTLTLSEQNDWTGSFTDLDAYDGGQKIVYTVNEEVVDGYETVIHGDMENGFVITNRHTPETIHISGSKTWDDEDDQDGIRPETILIRLHANGEEVENKTVTADDNWSWSFEDLPKYEAGEEIQYRISEDTVADYSASYDGYDVTNSYTPGKTSVTVIKNWKDNNDQFEKRPDEITVVLLADGVKTGKTLTLNEENNWMGSFTALDVYKSGQKITYTVEEISVSGYQTAISGDAETGFTITNTYTPESSTDAPYTGDKSNMMLWLALLLMSGAAVLITIIYRKKSQSL